MKGCFGATGMLFPEQPIDNAFGMAFLSRTNVIWWIRLNASTMSAAESGTLTQRPGYPSNRPRTPSGARSGRGVKNEFWCRCPDPYRIAAHSGWSSTRSCLGRVSNCGNLPRACDHFRPASGRNSWAEPAIAAPDSPSRRAVQPPPYQQTLFRRDPVQKQLLKYISFLSSVLTGHLRPVVSSPPGHKFHRPCSALGRTQNQDQYGAHRRLPIYGHPIVPPYSGYRPCTNHV